MKGMIERENDILNQASELGLSNTLVDGIKLIFEKLKNGENLSYSEYQLLDLLRDIIETN